MAKYKNFRLIIGIVTALVLTFNAVILPATALEAGSVNETGSVEYIEDDHSALEPAESESAQTEEDTQNDSVGTEEDTQGDKKENIPQEGESGQEAGAPSENAGDAVGTNQEEAQEDTLPDPDTRVKLWEDWRKAANLPAPTGDRAKDMASAARALLGYSLRGEDSGAFCWNRLLAEFCLDYAEVSEKALPRPKEGQDWAELLKSADLFRWDEEAIAAGTLVFLALDGQDGEGRLSVGIVTEIEEGVLTIVMADENGTVVSQSVARNDASFVGYCLMEENSGQEADAPSENAEDAVGTNQEEENSGQEADAPSENAGDAVGTNQEEAQEDTLPDPDTRVKLWEDWREAAKLSDPTGDRAKDMASAARALVGHSLRGEDSGAFCWNRLLAEFCLDYAKVSEEALPRPEEGQGWAELLENAGLFRRDEEAIAAGTLFCLDYAEVSEEALPRPEEGQDRAELRENADLFRRDEEAIAAGTLVFLALDGQNGEGRMSVGIVTEIEEGFLTVVMADENGTVGSQSVARNDPSFAGYCLVEENSGEAATLALEKVDGWALVSNEEELDSALNSTEETIKIKLRGSFPVVNAPVEIPAGKKVTMDLNGQTLTNKSNEKSAESLFQILAGATLTIEDRTPGIEENSATPEITTSTGNKYGNTASYKDGTLTYYVTDSTVTDPNTGKTTETVYQYKVPVPSVPQEVSAGTLDGNGIGKSIFWMSGEAANLIIKGGKICKSSKTAIYCDSSDSTVQIDGGYICDNSVNEIGGGAAISAMKPTTIKINGGYIYNNTSHSNGGAIAARTGSTINITGGCIFENTAAFESPASDGETAYGLGGAIYSNGANVTVSGGYIFSNSAITNRNGGGGAIYAQGGLVELNGGYLFDNSAKGGYGGAVYMKGGALTVSDSAVLAGNCSVKEGGKEVTAANGETINLDAGGGAVALFGSTTATISGGYITGNESEKTGGGLYCKDSAAVTMSGGYVTNNKAQNIVCEGAHFNEDGGGGIRLEKESNLTLNDGYITGNMAGGGAGICVRGHRSDATLTMNGGFICANRNEVHCGTAGHQKEGAGISIREVGAIVHIKSGYINNNSIAQSEDWGGGGIFCTEGAYLYIDKILATNNHARGFGGGLAGCPTGHVYVLGGETAVFDNRANGTQLAGAGSTKHADRDALADPTFMESGYSDFFCALGGQVQKTMLGGGKENWKGSCDGQHVNAEEMSGDWLTAYFRMGLTAKPTDADKSKAYEAAAADRPALYINGNESYTHGGAIMCDGFMFVGDWSDQENITVGSTMDVTAKKAFGQLNPIDVFNVTGPNGVNDHEGISCLFDQDPNTKWCNTDAAEACEGIFFDTKEPVKAIQYSLTMANDHQSNPKRVPSAWTLYGRNGNESWTVIDKGDEGDKMILLSAKNEEKVTFSIMHRGEYQYYKLVFDKPGEEGVQFADFELYDWKTSPMGDKQFAFEVYQFPVSYTAVTETANSGPAEVTNNEGYENLFDGNPGTKWYYKGDDSPASIIFHTDGAVKALQYSLTTAGDHTSCLERIPKAWTLYGGHSEDANGEWTVIAQHTEDDNCFQNIGNEQEVTFDIPSPASYEYYKLQFENSVSTEIQFSEFKLYTGEANTIKEPSLVSTGHNDAAGNITFSNRLSFDHAGVYFFGVIEKKMEGSITSDRRWYKVAVTVGTKTENITGSNPITKNTYYIQSIKVEQFMNTEGNAGTVTEQGLQAIWEKEWDVDGLKYINNPYHLFLSDNKDETGVAGDSSNNAAAFVNVQKEKTVNVTVQKQWASYMDANEYYTYYVTVQLFRKKIGNEAAEWERVEENVLNRAEEWKHTWYQLDEDYIYSVKETEVYYFDSFGNRKGVSPQSFTTVYSTGGETWVETFDEAAFRPDGSAESGTIQIRNTKKYYPMPETGGAGSDPFTVGGLAMVVLAAVMFLMHLRRQKKQA